MSNALVPRMDCPGGNDLPYRLVREPNIMPDVVLNWTKWPWSLTDDRDHGHFFTIPHCFSCEKILGG